MGIFAYDFISPRLFCFACYNEQAGKPGDEASYDVYMWTSSPEFGQIGIDLSSNTEQLLNDIILQHSIMTHPFLRPKPHQRLKELLVTLSPTYRVQMLPERTIKGHCI